MLMTNETRLGSQSEAQNIRIFKLYFLLFSHKLRAELNRSLQNTMNLCITGNISHQHIHMCACKTVQVHKTSRTNDILRYLRHELVYRI
jgi:hypothetical protein